MCSMICTKLGTHKKKQNNQQQAVRCKRKPIAAKEMRSTTQMQQCLGLVRSSLLNLRVFTKRVEGDDVVSLLPHTSPTFSIKIFG